ncbi:hypothetical protein LOTGIDRAFT_56203, partial [Lottia gigantea]
ALASFPGSGNTWLRHMIQQVTGIATGSIFNDSSIYNHGFPGEGYRDDTVIVIKTHKLGLKERKKYQKAVVLIRDPLDAIRSNFNVKGRGHLSHAPYSAYRKRYSEGNLDRTATLACYSISNYWPTFTRQRAIAWYMFYLDWLEFKGPLHVIQYEKLRNDTAHEMQKLLRFLAVPYTQSNMSCMLRNREGDFKRKAVKKLKPFQRFSSNMTKLIES